MYPISPAFASAYGIDTDGYALAKGTIGFACGPGAGAGQAAREGEDAEMRKKEKPRGTEDARHPTLQMAGLVPEAPRVEPRHLARPAQATHRRQIDAL
jgi:hypothetical protein